MINSFILCDLFENLSKIMQQTEGSFKCGRFCRNQFSFVCFFIYLWLAGEPKSWARGGDDWRVFDEWTQNYCQHTIYRSDRWRLGGQTGLFVCGCHPLGSSHLILALEGGGWCQENFVSNSKNIQLTFKCAKKNQSLTPECIRYSPPPTELIF